MYFNFCVFSLLFSLFFLIVLLLFKVKVKTCFLISSFVFYIIWVFRLAFWSMPSITISTKPMVNFGTHQQLNFIFLMPLGFYLVYLFKIKNIILLFLISFFIPCLIEGFQEYITALDSKFIYHRFSYDDIFFNFSGCFLASLFSLLTYNKTLKHPTIKQ